MFNIWNFCTEKSKSYHERPKKKKVAENDNEDDDGSCDEKDADEEKQ